jgi:hypothetical protein
MLILSDDLFGLEKLPVFSTFTRLLTPSSIVLMAGRSEPAEGNAWSQVCGFEYTFLRLGKFC